MWSAASDCSSDIRWNDSGRESPVAYLMVCFCLQWACFLVLMTVSTSSLTSGHKYQFNNNFVAKLFVHTIRILYSFENEEFIFSILRAELQQCANAGCERRCSDCQSKEKQCLDMDIESRIHCVT